LPGVAGLAALLIAAPLLASAGWPPLFAFYGPMSITIVAVEAAYLWREHRRRVAAGDPRPVVAYRRRLRTPVFVGLVVGLVLVGFVATGLLGVVDGALTGSVFAALPTWWLIRDPAAIAAAPGTLVAATFAIGIVINGFVGPIVEEAYFRGHLLPGLSRLGWRAPLLNAVLFSLYHLWQPWAFASRLGYVLPYTFAVHRTRSIYLGVAVHCAANLLGILLLIALVGR
jgi:membrane protease YdiL (CAAX protease family)